MNRACITLTLFLFAVGAAVALDFGLTLEDTTAYAYSDSGDLVQKNRATAWLSFPAGGFDVASSARVEYRSPDGPSPLGELPVTFDVGRLELTAYYPQALGPGAALGLTIGRFLLKDQGNQLFSGRLDGIGFRVDLIQQSFAFVLGYTGLLPKDEARVMLSKSDVDDYVDNNVYFAPPRIFTMAQVEFTELFLRQDLRVALAAQFDLRHLSESNPSEVAHTQYVTATLSGPLGMGFYYSSYLDVGIGQTSFGGVVMAAAGLTGKYFAQTFLGARAELSMEYASGSSGALAPFRPMAQHQLGFAYNAPFANSVTISLDGSLTPWKFLTSGTRTIAFFRSSGQRPEDPEFDASSTDAFLGTEVDAYLLFKLSSDFSATITGGVFVPYSGGSYKPGTQKRYLISATASLSL